MHFLTSSACAPFISARCYELMQFPEDLLSKLKNHEIQPTGHGIGILNIDTRIKLTYGETYGIIFYNEGEYAVAKLRFPVEREEGETCTS